MNVYKLTFWDSVEWKAREVAVLAETEEEAIDKLLASDGERTGERHSYYVCPHPYSDIPNEAPKREWVTVTGVKPVPDGILWVD